MDYTLTALGFTVEHLSWPSEYKSLLEGNYQSTTAAQLGIKDFHRVIVNSPTRAFKKTDKFDTNALLDPTVLCRVTAMHFWCNYEPVGNQDFDGYPSDQIDPRHFMCPYVDTKSLGMPYFVHSEITMSSEPSPTANRGRVGFFLAKECSYFRDKRTVALLRALADANFEMHGTAECAQYLEWRAFGCTKLREFK